MSDRLGRLLVHPLRHRLLLEYANGPESPSAIAQRLDEPVNLIAYHTGVLLRHGFVELVRRERRRGALVRFYRSTVDPVIDDEQWQRLPGSLRRTLAVGAIELIADDARRAVPAGGFDHADAHVSRYPLELDREGVREVVALLHAADAALARIAREGASGAEHEVVMLGFEPPR
ncbi:winged helix-turn-helix domain-containing protein [Solirubrobacter soli]|uniref:winged helix-turn-helix domain-containing protein n=1 Tax=Solirubrobacter soli TaxID=363832 RepID=UPI000415A67F|nr:helix-turn-helix domain-containing protein [Solirubrobacter soli]